MDSPLSPSPLSPGIQLPDTPAGAAALTIVAPVADVRREPASDAELVTQALLNVPALALEEREGWMRIRLSDYEGWVTLRNLGHPAPAPAPESREVAVVLPPVAAIFVDSTGGGAASSAYATTVLPVLSASVADRVQVALPGGSTGWMECADVAIRPAGTPFPPAGPAVATALACRYLGTPYLWGGTTCEGVDCSGLVQVCCRAAGRIIPRDADQQYERVRYIVERGDLRAGDLIYFAFGGAITHVGMMLDDRTYIHAKGEPHSRVMLNSLAPSDDTYSESLTQHYAGGRRPFA